MTQTERPALEIEDWVVRIQEPEGTGPHPVLLLLHGWTGDENAMWVFSQRFPQDHLLIAPRAPHEAHESMGGFSWYPRHRRWPAVEDFVPAIDRLLALLTTKNFPSANFDEMRAVGFSQGAATAYTMALMHPQRLQALGGLAGFMPEDAETFVRDRPLVDKRIFVAHGAQDTIVEVERARASVDLLQRAGAHVTYCEDDVGHKLSLTCFKALETFLKS